MRIALAQINAVVGDLPGNSRIILSRVDQAKVAGADLVIFPELALTGYPPEDLLLKPQFIKDTAAHLKALARQITDLPCVIGHVEQGPRQTLFNSAAVIENRRIKGSYHKRCLPNYSVFDEKRYFVPGNENLILDLGGYRVGLTICEDIWEEKGPVDEYARLKPDLLVNLSASPYFVGKIHARHRMGTRWARLCRASVAYCNLVGGQDELVFDGGSFAMTSSGRLIASAPQFEENLLVVDLPVQSGRKSRTHPKAPTLRLSKPNPRLKPQLNSRTIGPLKPVEEIYRALVLGTRDYVQKNGFGTVALGLSGGIDSALVAALAVEALGKDRVVAVTMPSPYTSSETFKDSQAMADNLGIRLMTLPIENVFKGFLGALSESFEGRTPDITEENLQARIRGALLMALSNKFGWLILTTGNKSEISTGYCTLYGDTAGGFAIIKDVPKTMVYQLSLFFNTLHGREIIPASIITRPPTAELKLNQKDQDTLPPYDLLDKIIKGYVEEDRPVSELIRSGLDETVVRQTVRMIDASEYKRRQAPPGIKITSKAFGKDRRVPITNLYRP